MRIVSQSQRTPAPDMNWLATIHHGLPLTLVPFTERSEEYLAFLGRIDPEKGPDVAIRVSHAGGLPLRIAAKVPRGHTRYFKETIKPLMEGNGAHFVGEVNDREKQSFLGKARALLFPINWPEPFGLVMIEANGMWDARHRMAARISPGGDRGRCDRLHRRVGGGCCGGDWP